MASPSLPDANAAIASYTRAIERRLRPTLNTALASRDAAYAALAETDRMATALDVLDVLSRLPTSSAIDEGGDVAPALRTRVNIGEEFYADAVAPAVEPVIVDVGLGLLVEMTRDEARQAIKSRHDAFEKEAARQNDVVASVSACLGGVLERVEKLSGEVGGWQHGGGAAPGGLP